MIQDHFLRVDRAELDRMRTMALQLGAFILPVLDAAAEGRIELVYLHRDTRAPMDLLRRTGRPTVTWIGDDDEASSGPNGWRSAHQVTRWARAALVHGAGGERQHYAAAVDGAEAHGRFALIETSSRHVSAWASLLPYKPVLIVVPRGGEHPVAGVAEVVH